MQNFIYKGWEQISYNVTNNTLLLLCIVGFTERTDLFNQKRQGFRSYFYQIVFFPSSLLHQSSHNALTCSLFSTQ